MTTKIPVELSSTPGIVDGSNATAITIDSSENVGIGQTTNLNARLNVTVDSGNEGIQVYRAFGGNGGGYQGVSFAMGNSASYSNVHVYSSIVPNIISNTDGSEDGSIAFYTSKSGTNAEKVRIDEDGNVGIGTTTDVANSGANTTGVFWNGNRLSVAGDPAAATDAVIQVNKTNSVTTNNNMIIFALDGVFQGDIDLNGGLVRYNTSSDYRLKENVVTEWDATTRLKQLKPSRFNFKNHPSNTIDGFLAHEVASIVPEAISGEKDAVDSEGNPEYQGIDHSKLVPLLVKTIQELEARITTLEGE